MVALSKFFQDHILEKTCQQLLIHTDSCSHHCLSDIPLFTLSNFKYFAPVCLIPAVIKLHRMDKKKLQNTLGYYLESALTGTAVGYTTNLIVCSLRHLLGQFGFYTFLFFPSFIGGCMVNLGSPRVIQLFETSMFQCLPLLINWRKLDKPKLLNTLEYYLQSSLTGTAVGCSTELFFCLFRNLLDQFNLYTFIFLPAAIGGCMLNFGSPRVKDLFETSIFQCNVETFFLMRRNIVSRLIADSRLLQTYVFMLCSAIILQGKQLYNLKGFWLLSPNPKLAEKENPELGQCDLHDQPSCNDYLLQGMRKYFALGLTLDLVKTLMSKVDATQNQSKLFGKFKNFRIRSTALLTAYMGIYRFTHCYLNRHFRHTDSLNHVASAFLAGLCYYFYPQSTLFSYALVQAIRTLWSMLKIENSNTKSSILQFLFRIPFGKILFPLALGNSVHLVCLKPEYCSPLTNTITNGVTNNYPNHIKNEIILLQQRVKQQMSESGRNFN